MANLVARRAVTQRVGTNNLGIRRNPRVSNTLSNAYAIRRSPVGSSNPDGPFGRNRSPRHVACDGYFFA